MTLYTIAAAGLLVLAGSASASAQSAGSSSAPTGGSVGIGRPIGQHGGFRGMPGGGFHGHPHGDGQWGGHWNGHGDGHGHRRFHGLQPLWGIGYWPYGGGYVHTEPSRDWFGYFGTDGEVQLVDGAPVYDYDRSYPYDDYDAAPGPAAAPTDRGYQCETRNVPDGRGGGSVAVRICRR